MESFITRCSHCRCRLRIPAKDNGKAKQTVQCSRCLTIQSVSSPPRGSLESAQPAPPRLRQTSSWEKKAVWILLPVTAWLAWNELGRSTRPIEGDADKVRGHVKSSPSLPAHVWRDFESALPAFSVRLPGKARSEQADSKGNDQGAQTWSVILDGAHGADALAFHVSCFKIAHPDQLRKFQGTLHWLTCLQAQDFPDLRKCAVRPFRKNGVEGGEFLLELGDGQAVRHAYVHQAHVVYLTCVGSNLDRYEADWRLFVDSLELKEGADVIRGLPEPTQQP